MNNKIKDVLFKTNDIKKFDFNEAVATVFDDMLHRSIPFYDEVIDLSINFVLKNCQNGDKVYDLGCSTATFLLKLSVKSDKNLSLNGIDNSEAMLKIAQQKSDIYDANINFFNSDIVQYKFDKSKAIISNYTLQFIKPQSRKELIKNIYDSLEVGGVFIFSEKVICDDEKLNADFIDDYYSFKRKNGYSDFEIMQKKQALEDVLISYSYEKNRQMILDAGFVKIECLFKWLNFATFIAIK